MHVSQSYAQQYTTGYTSTFYYATHTDFLLQERCDTIRRMEQNNTRGEKSFSGGDPLEETPMNAPRGPQNDARATQHDRISARKNLMYSTAIIIAGLAIAAAILIGRGTFNIRTTNDLPDFSNTDAYTALTPIDLAADHILGNPNAPVLIVEYSDFNCAYCQVFYSTMQQLMKDHGQGGDVAWVYRHLPIITEDSLQISLASECVADAGGNDAFWKFTDELFAREQGTHVDVNKLTEYAVQAGADRATYTACVANNPHRERVQDITRNAITLGVQGTPDTFAIVKEKVYPIDAGALPYAKLTQRLSEIIASVSK